MEWITARRGNWIAIALFLVAWNARGQENGTGPAHVIPHLTAPTLTHDGGRFIEGTSVAPPLTWQSRVSVWTEHGLGPDHSTARLMSTVALGLGLPGRIETALAFPFGMTNGVPTQTQVQSTQPVFAGLGDEGAAIGDLSGAILFSALDASHGGFGLLFGVKGSAPTGNHERLMGEGDWALEPFVAGAFQVLGSRFSINLGYGARPEHVEYIRGKRVEQDDDLIWRVGIRIPRKFDIAWSLEATGAIGVATRDGIWPNARSRPVLFGAGIDFPVERRYRFAVSSGAGVGDGAPVFMVGFRFQWMPRPPDEDEDGVADDQCPLLKEDVDGFQDRDGCPDLDNDSDGFPDDEDACPVEPASPFSEDGC